MRSFPSLRTAGGVSDKEVMEVARRHNAILLTEDSDFGEWIFAHKEKNVSVIFLRYKSDEIMAITASLIRLLNRYDIALYGKFAVITVKKVRVREIY